jgi:hypothetical protein
MTEWKNCDYELPETNTRALGFCVSGPDDSYWSGIVDVFFLADEREWRRCEKANKPISYFTKSDVKVLFWKEYPSVPDIDEEIIEKKVSRRCKSDTF